MRTSRLTAVCAGTAAAALLIPSGAVASGSRHGGTPEPVVRSDQLAAPFNIALGHHEVYVADGGMNLVGRLTKGGDIATIAADQPGASGVALSKDGRRLAFTTTVSNPQTFENTASALHIWGPLGSRVVADTYKWEQDRNPDKVNHYGVENPSQCVIDAFTAAHFPYDYTGEKDSHAYSVAAMGKAWVVADAGANALLKVKNNGSISTLAVLPPQPTKITAEMAAALGFPSCVAGITYSFEPVPTDVEVGRDGMLYVTTLPGGPEDAVLGARGAVWKVDPKTHSAEKVAGGFLGATNLALGSHGTIYVAELFGGQISVVKHGVAKPYVSLPGVVAVETGADGSLWAATLGSDDDPPAPGTIVQIRNGRVHY